MRGVSIGPPSRSGYALRLGARIRPTALRSSLAKPESETSLSSVVTSYVGNTKDPFRRYTSFVTSYVGNTKDPFRRYTSFVTSAGGDTKDPYCEYTSFVTSAGGQTNHSPQSKGVARTTGGIRRRPLIDPLWVGRKSQRLGSDLPKDLSHRYTSFVTSAGGQTNHSPQSEGVARTTGGTRHRPLIDPLWVGLKNQRLESDLPKDLSRGYTSFVTSAGGQTNHSPQSEGIARTTGGTRHRPLIDPLWVGLGTANTFDSIEGTINWRPIELHG